MSPQPMQGRSSNRKTRGRGIGNKPKKRRNKAKKQAAQLIDILNMVAAEKLC